MVGAIPDCQIAGSTSLTLKWPFLLPSLEPDQFGKNDTETGDDSPLSSSLVMWLALSSGLFWSVMSRGTLSG